MDDRELRAQDPFVQAADSPAISVRTYNLIMAGLILLGFVVMGAGSLWTKTLTFQLFAAEHPFVLLFAPLIGSIAGIVMMSSAASRQSTALSLAGFAVFVASFGIMAGAALSAYDLPTINAAFFATAAITGVAGIVGVAFPSFSRRLGGILTGVLLAVIVVELVLLVMHVDQTVTDYLVVALFAGFIAYDFNRAARLEPTVPNAVISASNLFLDIINILLRLLRIFSRNN